MATIEEKIAATEFSLQTRLPFKAVVAAADDAAQRSGNIGTAAKRADLVEGRSVSYAVKRLGAVGVGLLKVDYEHQGDGLALVRFTVPDYLVSQSALLWVIPVGPKESPALPVARAFAKILEPALRS